MKDEYKILIGAIIVILIVLVGAYALSGSGGPAPTPTPTVAPTNTPTPTPVASVVPSASPSVAPSATPVPSVTPTPMPESGIKLTEFGYWITYPPLGPQTWSSPKPKPVPTNIVYFDPTSAIIEPGVYAELIKGDGNYARSLVIRSGDLNGTVNVTLHMAKSSNIEWDIYPDAIDYVASMHGANLTDLGDGDYRMTFGPDVEEQYVCVHVNPYNEEEEPKAMQALPTAGWVKVTITGADGGYSVGADKDFTVNIKNLPLVTFNWEPQGFVYFNGTAIVGEGDIDSVETIGDTVRVTLPIYRELDTNGDLSVSLNWTEIGGSSELSRDAITVQPFAFADGQDEGLVTVEFNEDLVLADDWYNLDIIIEASNDYDTDWNRFNLAINPR